MLFNCISLVACKVLCLVLGLVLSLILRTPSVVPSLVLGLLLRIGSNTESKTASDTLSSTSWRILFCSHFYKVKVAEKTSINLLRFNQCSISLQMRILTPFDLFYVPYRSKMLHPKIWPYRSWSYQIVRNLNTDLKLNKWSDKSSSKVKILESVRIDH